MMIDLDMYYSCVKDRLLTSVMVEVLSQNRGVRVVDRMPSSWKSQRAHIILVAMVAKA